MPGNLSFCVQSNLPPSTITPPIAVPWPPMNLVAECTTTSAPCSRGRNRKGEAKVLSTMSGIPRACATSASASMSATLQFGLSRLSTYRAFVFSRDGLGEIVRIAAVHEGGFNAGFGKCMGKQVRCRRTRWRRETMWSPARAIFWTAQAMAAAPVAASAPAPLPGRRCAFSKTSAVGFIRRL